VFTRSRAVATAVAMLVARAAVALAPFAVDSAVMAASAGSLGAVLALRKSVNR
jgi:hypothetical protein